MTTLRDLPLRPSGDEKDYLLTAGEVATLFGVGAKTVTRWAAAGKLPCIKTLGGHRRFYYRDMMQVRARQLHMPVAPPS